MSGVKWHHKNGISIVGTGRKIYVVRKQIRMWLIREEKLQQQRSLSRAHGRGRTARFPLMESVLYSE